MNWTQGFLCAGFFFMGMPAMAAVAMFTGDPDSCRELQMDFKPLDYRIATPSQRAIVETYHFTTRVATLQGGESTAEAGADIAYTLRAFPNHPRALYAMAELGRRQKRAVPDKSWLSVECWFHRAVQFRPDDGQVRIIYGLELLKDGKREAAIEELERGIALIPDNGNAHYNVGLAYFEVGNYDAAREHARQAQSLGFSLPGLQRKLAKIGKWE